MQAILFTNRCCPTTLSLHNHSTYLLCIVLSCKDDNSADYTISLQTYISPLFGSSGSHIIMFSMGMWAHILVHGKVIYTRLSPSTVRPGCQYILNLSVSFWAKECESHTRNFGEPKDSKILLCTLPLCKRLHMAT